MALGDLDRLQVGFVVVLCQNELVLPLAVLLLSDAVSDLVVPFVIQVLLLLDLGLSVLHSKSLLHDLQHIPHHCHFLGLLHLTALVHLSRHLLVFQFLRHHEVFSDEL